MAMKPEVRVEKALTALHPDDPARVERLLALMTAPDPTAAQDTILAEPEAQTGHDCYMDVPQFYHPSAFADWMATRSERLRSAQRVVVCGARDWDDETPIAEALDRLGPDALVIQGEAPGADRIVRDLALRRGVPVVGFPALWKIEGNSAGPKRNGRMLACEPELVLAFAHDLAVSRGTRSTVEQSVRRGIHTVLCDGRQWITLARTRRDEPQAPEAPEAPEGPSPAEDEEVTA